MRYASIDVLRTLSIILMVLVHFLENLAGVAWAPAGFGAPMFGFLVGVSYSIWVNSQFAKGRTDEQISASTFKRGVVMTALGFLFNVLVWLPADTFNWDVLTLIGSSFFILWLIRETPAVIPLFIAWVVYSISPILRMHSSYDDYWLQGYYDPDWEFSQLALGYLVNGYFPIFPWVMFPLIGYVVGKHVISEGGDQKESLRFDWYRFRPVVLCGIGCLIFAVILRANRDLPTDSTIAKLHRGWTMFPASLEYVTTVMGLILLGFSFTLWWVDGKNGLARFPALLSFSRTMSQYSFSIYVFHHVIHLWPMWLYAVVNGQPAITYWRNTFQWPVAMALVIPCIGLCFLVFRWIQIRKYPSIETLIRRLCD